MNRTHLALASHAIGYDGIPYGGTEWTQDEGWPLRECMVTATAAPIRRVLVHELETLRFD